MAYLEGFFWACLAVNVLTYAGYPAGVMLAAALKPRRRRPQATGRQPPDVSIIICAHNEEAAILSKLQSVLASDYPGQMEILVGDDGSTDTTFSQAQKVRDDKITIRQFPRSGKATVLNALAGSAAGDVLVFSDADPIWRPDTLSRLVEGFGDPAVGATAGVVLTQKSRRRMEEGDRLFRRYENLLRRAEDKLFGVISADGGIFAVRRAFYEPPPAGVTDDFFISTGAVVNGARIAFAEQSIVYEESIAAPRKQLRRRMRITVRGLASVWARRRLLNPFNYGAYAVGLFFHKVMRRIAPAFLLAALFALLGLGAGDTAYRLPAIAALFLMVLAPIPVLVETSLPAAFKTPGYFMLHAYGLAAGTVLYLFGVRYTQWTPAKEPIARVRGGL